MAAPKRTPAQWQKANQFRHADLLDEGGLRTEFDQLVAAGCTADTLSMLLELLDSMRGEDRWESLTGFGRRELGTVLKRMAQCAKDIERLKGSGIAHLLLAQAAEPIKVHLLVLPKVLHLYSDFVKSLAGESGLQPRAKRNTNPARAILTQYVIQVTGQPHDNEVARLLSVVENRRDLTAVSHKDWRSRQRELLRRVAPLAAGLANHRPQAAL